MSIITQTDVTEVKADRLVLVAQSYMAGFTPSDAYILSKLQSAEKETSRTLKVLFEPTHIFPTQPTDAQITALAGKPWLDEPGYDYDVEFFQAERWGYIVTRQHPILSVVGIRLAYPAPTNQVFTIPPDWLRMDRKYGHIRLVPASSAFVAPLGAFLLQALGGGSSIPSMIQVEYIAGLEATGVNSPFSIDNFPDLLDVIKRKAVLSMLQDAFVAGSSSISADGMSQSMSLDMQKYEDVIALKLNGPKGSNGGLWTAFNGLPMAALGTVT